MKALLICSVHALFDIAVLEQKACNAALARHMIPAQLSAKDHSHVIEQTTMLQMIDHLPVCEQERASLVETYLEILNEEIWTASVKIYKSVYNALMDPQAHRRPTGFVSEYPMLTTNLARATALPSNATKLGSILAPPDLMSIKPMSDALAACGRTLNVPNDGVEVLVARRCDYAAARSIGMRPRFIDEIQLDTATTDFQERRLRKHAAKIAMQNTAALRSPALLSA